MANIAIIVGEITRVNESDVTTKSGETMKIVRGGIKTTAGGTAFPNFRVIGKSAENFAKYRKVGDKVLIRGTVQTDSYEKDGKTVYTTEVFVQNWEFVDKSAPDVNQVFLTGRLANDMRMSEKAKSFPLAVQRDKEKSDFPRCVLFGDALSFSAEKGDNVMFCGRITTGSYEKDGVKTYTTDMACDTKGGVGILQKKGSGSGSPAVPAEAPAPAPDKGDNDAWEALEEDVPF